MQLKCCPFTDTVKGQHTLVCSHIRSQSDASVPMSVHRQEIALTAHALKTKHFQYLVYRPYDYIYMNKILTRHFHLWQPQRNIINGKTYYISVWDCTTALPDTSTAGIRKSVIQTLTCSPVLGLQLCYWVKKESPGTSWKPICGTVRCFGMI